MKSNMCPNHENHKRSNRTMSQLHSSLAVFDKQKKTGSENSEVKEFE